MMFRDPTGFYAWAVLLECLLLSLLCWARFVVFRSAAGSYDRQRLFISLWLAFVFTMLAANQFFGAGRPVLSVGPLLPASYLLRLDIIPIEAWLKRLAEPAVWILVLSLQIAGTKIGSVRFRAAALLFLFGISIESLMLQSSVDEFVRLNGLRLSLEAFHAFITQAALLLLIFALLRLEPESSPSREFFSGREGFVARALPMCILVSIFLALPVLAAIVHRPIPLSIGAHYYTWFPENWVAGVLGDKLVPPVEPALSRYHSGDDKVISQHIEWAKAAKIDFFVLDWWPKKYHARKRADKVAEVISHDPDLKFAIQYEAEDLKEKGEPALPGEHGNIIVLTPERSERLAKHWLYLAKNFMKNPAYLSFGGRPVLFVYSTRHIVGPVREALWRARQMVWAEVGVDLFLVGDEAFRNVLADRAGEEVIMLPEFVPNWERASAFDALTIYNPYEPEKLAHAGTAGVEAFFADTALVYERYQRASAVIGVPFFPTAIPGFNDRGVRLSVGHYVLPPEISSSRPETFFERSLQRLVRPFLSPDRPVGMITSWNEWNEWTQIEPTRISEPTTEDRSSTRNDYTQGESYRGYGTQYLEILKQWRAQ